MMKAWLGSIGRMIGVVVLAFPGMLQAVDPRLNALDPPGVQAGSELEMTFQGDRLKDTLEVLLYQPGVSVLSLVETADKTVKARIKVDPECVLGEHQLRLRTASGVSDFRTFHVGPFPVVAKDTSRKPEDPLQTVALNTTVYGSVAKESVDRYLVQARKGQRLSVETESMRLGRGFYDPYVSILDAHEKILARSDDTALFIQDCFASTLVPADGGYIVEIRETSYGEIGLYRLHIGDFARPTAVYPPGGPVGETLELTFIDPAGGDFKQSHTVPPVSPFAQGVFPVQEGVTAPSWNRFRSATFPNVLEQEPNNSLEQATVTEFELPLAFNGIIDTAGDTDWFRFKARKGQEFDVRVQARTLRSPLDSILVVMDGKGRRIDSNDDSGGPDSYLKFRVSEDGDYHVRVDDHLGNGGPDYIYRIEFSAVEPALSLYVPDVAQYDTQTRKSIVVARGNRFPLEIKVRRENFKGDLRLEPVDFPEGLTMQADVLEADKDTLTVVFAAASEAPVAGRLAGLKAAPAPGGEEKTPAIEGGVWQNVDLVQNGNQGVYYQTWVDQLAVAVVEELPFSIRLEPPRAPLVRDGSLPLNVVVWRKEGFDQEIKVRMLTRPPGLNCPSEISIPKDQTNATYTMSANGNAQIKEHQIALLGFAAVEGGTAYVATSLTPLRITDSLVAGKIPMATTIQGQPVQVKCELTQKEPFPGKARVELVGLPPGAKAEPREITKDDQEIVFEVLTEPDARKGLHRSLFCQLSLDFDSDQVTQSFGGRGTLRIDAPPPPPEPSEEEAASSGKKQESAPTVQK
jgi:hypothetical protein